MVAGLLKIAGFGPGLAEVCPGFGKGLTRVWLKGFVSGIGCSIAEDKDRKVHGLVLRLAELSSPYSMVYHGMSRNHQKYGDESKTILVLIEF